MSDAETLEWLQANPVTALALAVLLAWALRGRL